MRIWEERDSLLQQIKESEFVEKCRDGFDKAEDLAKETYGKAKNIGKKVCNYDYRSAAGKAKNKMKNTASFCFTKIKERNPIAIAVCVGLSALVVFSLFYAIFYTIFSLGRKK